MPGPVPVTGLQGFRQVQLPEATPEQRYGGPADPSHGNYGEEASPFPWEAYAGSWGVANTPIGAENKLLGDEPQSMTFQAGYLAQDPTGDQTPYRTHAAPHPTGSPNTTDPVQSAQFRQQSAEVHAVQTGAGRAFQYMPTMLAQDDKWEDFYNPIQGEDMVPDVPGQVAAQANGWGSHDRTSNPYHKANSYNLNTSHRHRRYATCSVPGNYMWMKPGSRPMSKSQPGPARPAVGAGPFYGQDESLAFNVNGAILQQGATEYVPPPQPMVSPATQAPPNDSAPEIAMW